MKVLVLGDIVGKIGRAGVKKYLSKIKKEQDITLVIVNGENTTHGSGIITRHYHELRDMGIDVITSGNHIWRHPQTIELLNEKDVRLIRPANFGIDRAGNGYIRVEKNGFACYVVNLIGQAFMHHEVNSPFEEFDLIHKNLLTEDIPIFVDFHAETTAEKMAFAHYVDGKVTFVWGTHTHVATADMRQLPHGTGYISDLGGCYAYDSILGLDTQVSIKKFTQPISGQHTYPEEGICQINGILLDLDDKGVLQSYTQILDQIRV